MPNFAEKVEIAVDALSYNPPREVDENEFIDASRLVYDGVRDIRQAVLLDRVSLIVTANLHYSYHPLI
jgi:catenin alpha